MEVKNASNNLLKSSLLRCLKCAVNKSLKNCIILFIISYKTHRYFIPLYKNT